MHESLSQPSCNYVNGAFAPIAGDRLQSHDPAEPSRMVWSGSPRIEHADEAVAAARSAFPTWSATSIDERIALLRRWQEVTKRDVDRIAGLITDEMGKVMSESLFEAQVLSAKVDITLDEHSMARVREYRVDAGASRDGFCRYKPHGVMAAIGPFNFPAHLANGHFVPALLMGNTVVFKPSEKTPAVGQLVAELMHEAGFPQGVFNVVQGGADVASALVSHDAIDGILFTGSWPVGRKILEANLDRPGRIVALEMGGNNPAVVMPSANLKQAVIECVRASFATTGQRCTCTRRIIVHRAVADRFVSAFCKAASTLIVGPGRSESPVFMGPVINEESADRVIEFQRELLTSGARALVESTRLERSGHFVTPGVVEVDGFSLERDCEVFGPLAQICVVEDFESAIAQANATRFGLAASIFTNDDAEDDAFFRRCNAGCINRNTGTAGASGKLPFGGVGRSGNHRPAGAFSVEYCAYPVASMVDQSDDAAATAGMLWDDAWLGA